MIKNSNHKKGVMFELIVAFLLVVTLGVTFAIWNYSRVGDNQLLVTGDIYMKFKEDNTLSIEKALPREEYIPGKYFEFTVEGVNNYSKDIHYQILLSEGEAPTGVENKDRTERIRPDLLLFKLVEVENGEEKDIIFDRMSYPELDNTSVWVDTIKAKTNTKTKTSKTYRLYMWVSPLTKIGVGDNLDYDMDTWNDKVYGSVKVTVQGDFNEKEAFSCFPTKIIATYNEQRTDEQVNACVEWMTKKFGTEDEWADEGASYQEFCEGTGTLDSATFQNFLDMDIFNEFPNGLQELLEIGIINAEIDNSSIGSYSEECSKDVMIPRYMNKSKITTIGGGIFQENQLTSVNIPNSVTTIGTEAFAYNQLTNVNIPDSVTTIEYGAFENNQLTSVNIPDSVISIGVGAFSENQLTSVNIPEGVITIGLGAFYENQLTSVNIPDSVSTIGVNAFIHNQLTSVTIGNGIKYIGSNAFEKTNLSNILLDSIKIDKTCSEIKNIEASPEDTTKEYPWLGGFYAGTTIYGSNGEVCDAF